MVGAQDAEHSFRDGIHVGEAASRPSRTISCTALNPTRMHLFGGTTRCWTFVTSFDPPPTKAPSDAEQADPRAMAGQHPAPEKRTAWATAADIGAVGTCVMLLLAAAMFFLLNPGGLSLTPYLCAATESQVVEMPIPPYQTAKPYRTGHLLVRSNDTIHT